MASQATPTALARRLRDALARRAARARKWLRQRRSGGRPATRTPVFVLGCQRSGTNMLISVLDRSTHTWTYDEGVGPAFVGYRLAEPEVVERCVARSLAPVVAFKPICDAQHADRLLERHPGSRALWIYRRVADVANSAVRNWGGHQKDIMRWISEGDWHRLGWRGELLAPESVEKIEAIYSDKLSPEEAGALFWWLRNRIYFDLGLDRDERVLLVRYEDLVGDPPAQFRRIFDFVGCPWDDAVVEDVFATSVGKAPFPDIDPRIRELCDELTARLDARLAESS